MAQSESGGYWPGLVDALTNVVFALILFVMVLALVFMVVVMKAVNDEKERSTAAIVAAEARAKREEPKKADTAPPVTPVVSPPQSTEKPQRRGDELTVKKDAPARADVALLKTGDGMFLAFDPSTNVMDADTTKALEQKLEKELPRIREQGVSLRADAVPAFVSEGRRKAYYRMMTLRNWLIDHGVAQDKIDVRITDTRLIDEKEGVLLSVGKSLAPKPAEAAQ